MIKVGDRVRSYDFTFNDYVYVEGIVEKIAPWEHCMVCDKDHVWIRVDVDTWWSDEFDDETRIGMLVFPALDDFATRIEVIG